MNYNLTLLERGGYHVDSAAIPQVQPLSILIVITTIAQETKVFHRSSQWFAQDFDILFSGIMWHHRTLGWYLAF